MPQRVDLHRHGVRHTVDLGRQRVVQGPEEALDRIPEETDHIGQRNIRGGHRRQRRGGQPGAVGALPRGGAGGVENIGVEAERLVGRARQQCARFDVAPVERLQRVVDDDPVPDRCGGGGVQGVQHLRQWHRRRSGLTGVLVGPGVRDHQGVGRRADRVEQQLTVLRTDVALPGLRVAGQGVVPVEAAGPGEDGVIESDQADHPVRHRPHRDHRADGQCPGAEVGPGGTPGQVAVQQLADVGQPQFGPGAAPGPGQHIVEFAVQLADLPGVVAADLGEQCDPVGQGGDPGTQRLCARQPADHRPEANHQFGEPAGQFDAVAADVVQRQGLVDPGLRVVGECHTGQDPVHSELPGVVHEVHAERDAMGLVETPAHVRLPHPVGDVLQVVVGEAEPGPHRFGVGHIEHLRRRGPAPRQVEQLGGHREQRVGLHQ